MDTSLDWSGNRSSNSSSSPKAFNIEEANLDDSLEYPENNLWVLSIDDPLLSVRFVEAIYHGVTLLVTHLERRELPKEFHPLLKKDFKMTKDGQRTVLLGETPVEVHENFALYFSCSVPLALKGTRIVCLMLIIMSCYP